jgi:hypothetical protein
MRAVKSGLHHCRLVLLLAKSFRGRFVAEVEFLVATEKEKRSVSY